MNVVVTGIGLISALGNLTQTWERLLEEGSGIQFYQPFSDLEPKPIALIGKYPAEILNLTQRVVSDAVKDAELETPLVDCGVVVGSSRGNQAQWEQMAAGKGEISNWLNTLPNGSAIASAQLIQSQGIVLAPMAACATGLWAIARGAELIQSGQCDRVICGAIEAPITPLTLIGFERMGALAKEGAFPFDVDRQGLVLGEGGAVFVLESAELARSRNAEIYGQVRGFGLTADGYHVSAPEPGSRAAIAAVNRCLERSSLTVEEIGYIHAHGTATQLNDRNEAHLIQQCFSDSVWVSSTKGATGHTLGGSGALGAAFCLMALRHQIVPPNVGMRNSEFELAIATSAQTAKLENVLCFSFGFGGQNAIVAFSR
ncbi:MAG: beta-ketoacyl-ACP synthase [Phormidium tanganyikae FI6-MK23]|jgi:3-oxoacyl-[acyl-carrier-protein] synthase II|nr:beta-ketoacyl-ACP synthase [Phormidium tanganyikae FI6-MK23]